MAVYLLVLLSVAAWRYVPRPWHPALTIETSHHIIFSTATREQTDDTAHALEILYAAYSNRFAGLAQFQPQHPRLKVKLFKDRDELRRIITNRGGPSMNRQFNLYYLHWWTLTHFVFESPRCREHALELVRLGGGMEAFEKTLGPVEQVQAEWHGYVRELKAQLRGSALKPDQPASLSLIQTRPDGLLAGLKRGDTAHSKGFASMQADPLFAKRLECGASHRFLLEVSSAQRQLYN